MQPVEEMIEQFASFLYCSTDHALGHCWHFFAPAFSASWPIEPYEANSSGQCKANVHELMLIGVACPIA